MMTRRIGDYGMIGDCETAALIGRDGSVDWLCFPRFDSPACFARLLGDNRHGYFKLAPTDPGAVARRSYVDGALVLETVYTTATGVAEVVDFMPIRTRTADLVRIVRGRSGSVSMRCELDLKFDYGRLRPWIEHTADGFRAIAGPHGVRCQADAPMRADHAIISDFVISAGQSRGFVLSYFPSHEKPPDLLDPAAALERTLHDWRAWTGRNTYAGPHRGAVACSLMVLKALTHRPTGGIVAAPTASLPEQPGGARNWDYRFCWLRDATFMLLTLLQAGYVEEARAWREWLVRAAAGDATKLQPLYGVAGEPRVPESTAPWLPGFGGARPVRIGNLAHAQFQLDVYGEILDVLHHARLKALAPSQASWRAQHELAEYICQRWTSPDAGIWESRAEPRHFTHSKVMAWVGLERCIHGVESFGLPGDASRWRVVAKRIREEVFGRGFNPEIGAFTREFDSDELDAAALLFPEVGFVEPNDPRMVSTVAAIERHLVHDGYVFRYDTRKSDDGLPPGEGVFLPCTCWLADVYAMMGRRAEAEALFEAVLDARNDLGLLSEEYDPASGELLGNFPQALSHVSLIDTAFNLARVKGPAETRREQMAAEREPKGQ